MGEGKNRSRKRDEIIRSEPRCIYCSGPSETVEHMPPKGMFRGKQRPGAMEYAACRACNNGTSGSDAVAGLMARLHPDNDQESWQIRELPKLIAAIDRDAPGVREEMARPGKFDHELLRRPKSGLLQRVVRIHADGPRVQAHLSIFGAKLAMALYREHVGAALPLDGAVWSQFSLNTGMTQDSLDARLKILPAYETLRQGSKTVSDQFGYRYNTDGRSIVAAVAQFNQSLWFTLFASGDQHYTALISDPDFVSLPATALVRPGELLSLRPVTAPLGLLG